MSMESWNIPILHFRHERELYFKKLVFRKHIHLFVDLFLHVVIHSFVHSSALQALWWALGGWNGPCQWAITQKTGNHGQHESSGVKCTIESWPCYGYALCKVFNLSEPLISHLKMGLISINTSLDSCWELSEITGENLRRAWNIISSVRGGRGSIRGYGKDSSNFYY